MKLEDIKKCITCSSTDFQYEPALEIDWTEDDTTRVVEAKRCLGCDDVYFIQDGCMARQFIPRRDIFEYISLVTDYEVNSKN